MLTMDRYGKGLAIGIGVHLLAAILIGMVSLRVNRTPSNIMEVTLAGGGGGAAATVNTASNDAPIATSKDDIVDKKLKPKENKPKTEMKKNAKQGAANSQGSGNGTGTGPGEGSGTGGGSGSGTGTGVGSGSGSGVETPTVPPRLLSRTQPRYPLGVRSRNIEGTTYVKMLVNSSGKVENAFIANSSGNSELDASAVECAYKWRFSPAKNSAGSAVQCYITIPIRFTLK